MKLDSVQIHFVPGDFFFKISLRDIKKGIKDGIFKDASNMEKNDFELPGVMRVYGWSDNKKQTTGYVFEAREKNHYGSRLYATYNRKSGVFWYLKGL